MKLRAIGVINLLAAMAAASSYGYPWPVFPAQGTLEDPSPINAVIAEYRDTAVPSAACAAPCPHFHDGVDIGRLAGTSVYPSVSGSVPVAGGLSAETVVVNTAGGVFRYVHVTPDSGLQQQVQAAAAAGATSVDVTAGVTLLGTINNNAHVHFRETDATDTNVQNNLRFGGLDNYSDTALPTVSNIALFDAQNPGAGPLGTVIPAGTTQINVRAHAQDAQSNGSNNTGIYQVGYQVYSGDGSQLLLNNFPKQTYDSFPRAWFLQAQKAYDTTISQGFSNGVLNAYYFASNDPNPNTAASPLDLTQQIFSGGGTFKLCVLAKDIRGNGGNVGDNPPTGAACTGLTVGSGPSINVTDAVTGTAVQSGIPMSYQKVSVAATSPVGVSRLIVTESPTSPGKAQIGFDRSYSPAQQSVTEPLDLDFSDGRFKVTAIDVNGSSTTFYFSADFGPMVQFSLDPPSGQVLTVDAVGATIGADLMPPSVLDFAVGDDISGLASLTITQDLGSGPQVFYSQTFGVASPTRLFSQTYPSTLAPGTYSYDAANVAGQHTTGSFVIYSFTLGVAPNLSRVTGVDSQGSLHEQIGLTGLNSGPGITRIDLYAVDASGNVLGSPVRSIVALPGNPQPQLALVIPDIVQGNYAAIAVDAEGNQVEQFVSLSQMQTVWHDPVTNLSDLEGTTALYGQNCSLGLGSLWAGCDLSIAVNPSDGFLWQNGQARSLWFTQNSMGNGTNGPPTFPLGWMLHDLTFGPGSPASPVGLLKDTPAGCNTTVLPAPGYCYSSDPTGASLILDVGNAPVASVYPVTDSNGNTTWSIQAQGMPLLLPATWAYTLNFTANNDRTMAIKLLGTNFLFNIGVAQVMQGPNAILSVQSQDQVCVVSATLGGLSCAPATMNVAGPSGLQQLSKTYLLDPSTSTPMFSAKVVLNFSSAAAIAQGLDPTSLAIYQVNPGGSAWQRSSNQFLNLADQTATTFQTLQRDTTFAIFGSPVAPPPPPPPPPPTQPKANTLAVGADAQGRLWTVLQTSSSYQLARFSPAGALQTAVALPYAASGSNWAINVDTAGFVYVIGAASGPYTVGTDLSVYKATLDPVLVSSTGFHGGVNGQALGFDASGDAWITGAIQQGSGNNGPPQMILALWHYCIHTGLLSLTATYSRAGTDAGFGVRVASNSVWVAGYSLNPQLQGLDLGLWQFDSQGKNLIGGPFFRPGYLTNLQNADVAAKLATNGTNLFVASERTSSGVNDLALLEYNLSGQVVSERAWHSSSGLNEAPHGIAFDASGNLLVAGGLKSSGSSTLGVWKYSNQGGLLAARTDPGILRANGIALQQSNIWLAVDGSSVPYLFQGSQALSGSDVFVSSASPADTTPPVSSIAIGASSFTAPDGTLYVSPASSITFSAFDSNNPDGSPGSGVARIEISLDSAPFAAFSGVLSLAEGIRFLQFRAVDKAGNIEAAHTLFLRSDATAPRTGLALGAPQYSAGGTTFVSTATPFTVLPVDPVSNGVASGIRQTFYSIGGGSSTIYSAPFTLPAPEGVKTISAYSVDNVANQEVARSTSVALDATPPQTSLALLGGHQFPGPSASSFYASSTTFLSLVSADPIVNGVASGLAQTQYQDNGGGFATYTTPFSLGEGVNVLAYQSQDRVQNVEVLHSTVALIDATPPVATIAIGSPSYSAPDGTIYVSTFAPISFSAADPVLAGSTVPGSGVNHIDLAKDTTAFSLYSSAISLPESRHTLLYRAIDNVANVENGRSIGIQSDGTPPVSSLASGQPQYQLPGVLLVSARTPFTITAADPSSNNVASGVKDTSYRVSDVAPSGSAFQTYNAAFSLAGADVNKVIELYSRDNVLNTEVLKSSTVLLDSTPPEIALLSPASCDLGICQVVKGHVLVLGTARDIHLASYTLDFAPGRDATAGFTTINTGNVAVSSASLGVWDTSQLSGWQTLRLTAVDLVQNVATQNLNVFIGDPGNLMILGGKDIFAGPQDVAIGPTGQLYVADTRHNRIAIFSAQGAFVKAFGGEEGSGSPLVLHHPEAVAVDPVGGIYVADTDADKVLKLSAMGQVQAYLSGFKRPSGVAVDLQGNVYVSDTGNHLVKKLSPTGSVVLTITLPPVPVLHEDSDDDPKRGKDRKDRNDDEDDRRQQLGRPRELALDASGAIYVADSQGSRALKFDPTGQILLSLPIARIGKDGKVVPGRPMGVAVNPTGDCWLVSDTHNGMVHRFDLQGNEDLLFQTWQRSTARKDHDDQDQAESKPQGIAVDAQGVLYVADRGRDGVMTFGVPTGMPPVVVRPVGATLQGKNLTVAGNFTKEDGGTLTRFDKAALFVSSGTLSEDAELFISTPVVRLQAEEDVKARKWLEAELVPVSTAAVFGPERTTFDKEVMVVVPYDQLLVQSKGLSEMNLQVFYWNPDKQSWQWLPSSVNLKDHTVSATTKHFSIFRVAGKQPKEGQQ